MIVAYLQQLDPLKDSVIWSRLWSTLFAALPVVVLFWLLVPRRWLAPKAGAAGALAAILIAIFIYKMPPVMAGMAFAHGVAFGLLPVGWTIFNTMLLYNITVETGEFSIVRRSVAGLSADARIQAILIAFAFGAFLEGAAGAGTPVAICGAIMVGLGFDPFLAAVLCLIANTSPVAFGGLSTPLLTLNGVTDLPTETLSVMAGHQLPLLSLIVPLYMVKCMCSWKQTIEVWPALLVAGLSFAVFQFTFATIHVYIPGLILYPMTDIGGGIFSLIVTAIFLRFWKPRNVWHFTRGLGSSQATATGPNEEPPLTAWKIAKAWGPYALMSVLLLCTGLIRQREQPKPVTGVRTPVTVGPVQTNYIIPVPGLHGGVYRDTELHPARLENRQPISQEQAAGLLLCSSNVLEAVVSARATRGMVVQAEKAEFDFPWLSAPGTAVFLAAVLSMIFLRMSRAQITNVIKRTFLQMKIPIPTIACMLGLSYVTRYAGMDATLGVAFAETGVIYPFFAAILGWLGVFLTGTDAGSNALFGSLQKITATRVFEAHTGLFQGHLDKSQLQVLICTANSTGGVMGKMIDAQSICVATAATHQIGREADIFKAVVWHSIILAAVVGLITVVQAYVFPFTLLVPSVPGK